MCGIVTVVIPGDIFAIPLTTHLCLFFLLFIYFLPPCPIIAPLVVIEPRRFTDPFPPKKSNADLNRDSAVFGDWFYLMRCSNGARRDLEAI